MTQIERITYYEELLDRLDCAVREPGIGPEALRRFQPLADELELYYTSPLWRQDLEDDEAGRLPPGLKRGILSQDAAYNVLMEYGSIMDGAQEEPEKH